MQINIRCSRSGWWQEEAGFGTWLIASSVILAFLISGLLWFWNSSSDKRATQKVGFGSFHQEIERVNAAISCLRPGVVPAIPELAGDGRLYGCIMGSAETAKFFINESGNKKESVENIKVMWNDYWKNTGYGMHADRSDAVRMVRALARLYAPDLEQQLIDAFERSEPRFFNFGAFNLEYRFTPGPAINERLLIVTER